MQQCPFEDGPGLIRFLQGNMARKKDNMLVSEGPEGSGKSTTSGRVCMKLNPAFDVKNDTIMNLDQLLEVLDSLEKGKVYCLDEAVNIFHNQDWATWEAKLLTKIIRQMRIMKCTWVLNVPDYVGLHPYIRDYRTRIRLYHEPVYDADGMGNGPAKVLWRSERFEYKAQGVRHWWSDVFDLHVDNLDDDPRWRPYENKKVDNFRSLVKQMKTRRASDKAKETKRNKKRGTKSAATTLPP